MPSTPVRQEDVLRTLGDDGRRFACGCGKGYGGQRDPKTRGWWFWHGDRLEGRRWFADTDRERDGRMPGLHEFLEECHYYEALGLTITEPELP